MTLRAFFKTMLALLCLNATAPAYGDCGCSQSDDSQKEKNMTEKFNDLIIEDTKEGTGAEAEKGKTVEVHYEGRLRDGTVFDSSRKRGEPISFPLGMGHVIQGWDQGIVGLKVGGQRTLKIPARLAYGERGAGGVIPPNADLIFDVELVSVA